jgi:hypothetical protein
MRHWRPGSARGSWDDETYRTLPFLKLQLISSSNIVLAEQHQNGPFLGLYATE